MKPVLRTLALIVVVLLLATSCRSSGSSRTPMTLKVISGSATLVSDDESTRLSSEESSSVEVGDRVVQDDGVALLSLASGRDFELREARVLITGTSSFDLERGDALAELTAAARVVADNFAAFAEDGTFRIDRGVATRVGVYDGSVTLNHDAGELTVPRFRQAVVAGGLVPKSFDPLMISAEDNWDRRFLQVALDLDNRLTNFGRGLEAQLGNLAGLSFFTSVAPPGADVSFLSSFTTQRRSDVLIGLMVAFDSSGASGMRGSFEEAFELWTRGASWGLIAVEFGASGTNLFSLLLDAIARLGIQIIGGGGGATTSPNQTGGGTNDGGGEQSDPSPPPESPSPSPEPDPVQSLVEETEELTEEVECTLAGLLGSPCE